MKGSFQQKWFLGLAALLVLLLVVMNLCLDYTLHPYLIDKIRSDLGREAAAVRYVFAPKLSTATPSSEEIHALAHEVARETGLRITIIARDGKVIGESDKSLSEIQNIPNHLDRPELQEALRSGSGSAMRHSETIGRDLMCVAVTMDPGAVHGFVRVALPLDQVTQLTSRVRRTIVLASLAVGILVVPLLLWLARKTTRPILEMADAASRIARGDFSKRVPTDGGVEMAGLASALNEMSTQLEARLRELDREKAGLSAILSSMTEGVLVVDASGRILLANRSLHRQFQVGDEAIGRTVLEVFRNRALEELAVDTLRGGETIHEREVTFATPQEHVFEVKAASLLSSGDSRSGAVIVFHDITRLQQLETHRKDFVANVSHELRTPLALIKGYIETLLDEPQPDPKESRRFLKTIQKHSSRLEALIADLLNISALESQQARLQLGPISFAAMVDVVTLELESETKSKSIAVICEIPNTLPLVRADSGRLHQVLFNLLDNALKYTQAGGRVTIRATAKDGEVECAVCDNGPGIASEHLPHLFERFYRVDRARSRDLGGTGLGLSIVKHIVQAHGGRVWVESRVGQGSSFHFTLPAALMPRHVLFVCVENSCRSQIAEAFTRVHASGLIEAHSAGSRPSGRVNPTAIELMKERGYDLGRHGSKSLDEIPAVEYDVAVTMGCGDACPNVRARRREDWNIPDPKKMAPEEFRKVLNLIEEKVRALVSSL